MTIKDSTFRNADSMYLGGPNAAPSKNVTIQNNGLYRCGNVNGPVIIQNATVDGVSVLNNSVIECGVSGLISPFYFVQNNDPQTAKVLNLLVTGNVVQPIGSNLTDIGRMIYRIDTDGVTYDNVNRDGNIPSQIGGGAENLYNYPP